MRKLTKGLLISVTVAALGWSVLSSLYTHEVSRELTSLKRESHSDVIYLRCRLRELEREWMDTLLDRLATPSLPVGDTPVDGAPADTAPETDTVSDTVTETEAQTDTASETEDVTESVTLPTHQSPETRPVGGQPSTRPNYLLTVHDGRIALLDAAGAVVETVNVFVMTLPAADRAALEVGIPVTSPEEARELMEKYR